MKPKASSIAVILMTIVCGVFSWAQNGPANINEPHGDQPFGAYQISDIDNIGFANGSVDIRIPLFSHSGRGLAHQKFWTYTSKTWHQLNPNQACDPSLVQCPPPIESVWSYTDYTQIFGGLQQYTTTLCHDHHMHGEWTNFTYLDPTGTSHIFDAVTSFDTLVPNCIHPKLVGYSLDNSGMRYDTTTDTITFKDGSTIPGASIQSGTILKSANGNSITSATPATAGEIDTLGRSVQHQTGTLPDGAQYEDWITRDTAGNPETTRIEWSMQSICTNFQQGDVQDACPGSMKLARKIDLPNGLAYQFTYDTGTTPGHFGELIRIDLPSGGYIRYEYAPIASGVIFAPIRSITKRVVSADGTVGSEKLWTYSYQINLSGNNTTTVTDPDGNQTAHVIGNTLFVVGSPVPLETQTLFYQGSTKLLKTVQTDYSTLTVNVGDSDDPNTTARELGRPIRITTTFANGATSKVEMDYDPLPDTNGVISFSRNNITEKREYDFRLPNQTFPLLRRTVSTYLHNINSAYANANIVDKVWDTIVYDGAGNIVAQTQNRYDESPLANTNTSGNCQTPNGAPNHDYCAFGTANLTRGNLTSVKRWRNTDNTWLPTTYSYDDLGNAISSTDPGTHATTFNYSDSWSGASCIAPGVNTYAFLTQVTDIANLRTQASYYSCPGLLQSKRDENDIVAGRTGTTFTYDGMNRLVTSTAVDGGVTSLDYHGDALPLTVTKTQTATPDPSIISSAVYDGLGRTTTSTLVSDPLGADSTDTTYDDLGRVATVSNPHRVAPKPTDGITGTIYDPLGRATETIFQDGSISSTNYDNYPTIVVTDPQGNQRRSRTDALGRLVEVDEPAGSSLAAQATTSLTISGAFNSTWVPAGTPHLAATGTALASLTMADGSSHDFYFDTDQHLCQISRPVGSGWANQDLTEMAEAPLPMTGSSLTAVLLGGAIHVFYQGANLHLYDMEWNGTVWQNLDMTAITGASPMSGTKMASLATPSGVNSPMVAYEGTNQHLYEVYWNTSASAWQNADLHALSGATTLIATNGSIGSLNNSANSGIYIFFIGTNQHVICINWVNAWLTGDVTSLSGGALATTGTALTTFSTAGSTPMMNVYVGPSQHIYTTYWSTAGSWQTLDFTAFTGATSVAAALTALSNNLTGPQAYYFGSNQHLNDINWNGSAWVNYDLTSLSGGVLAAAGSSLSSHGASAGNAFNVFFEGPNQHIYHTYSASGSTWSNEDTTATASNQLMDSGIVSLTIPNGSSNFVATVCYGESTNSVCTGKPVNITPSDIANAFATVLNGTGSPVNATVTGSTLNLTWRNPANINVTVESLTSTSDAPSLFPSGSFNSTSGTFTVGDSIGSAPAVTLYSYNALGNLICVEQHGDVVSGTGCSALPSADANSPWRVRRFTYDSLSQLTSSSNPESNTALSGTSYVRVNTTYTYDADGLLLQKTSPAPNQAGSALQTVSYCYDSAHRVIAKGYGPQSCPMSLPVVTYTYDVGVNDKGMLTSLTDQAGTASYTYDTMGRIATETRNLWGAGGSLIPKNMTYGYNLRGALKSIQYPSGAVITYTRDSAGHTVSAVDNINSISYATSAAYGPDGALTGFVSGHSTTFAGITNAYSYNKRLQPVNMSASSPSQTLYSIGYDFHLGNGTVGSDNGNVFGVINYKDTTHDRDQTFTYDPLNRLTSAQNAGTDCTKMTVNSKTEYWGNSYGYDAWGNLLQKNITKCGAENLSITALSSNQLLGYGYDTAGNMTSDPTDGIALITYDQENRITGASGYSYTYDSDGNRAIKSNGSTGTLYWAMTPGIVAETDLAGTTKSEYIFFDGERVARRDGATGTGGVFYYFSDHLKTASVITDSAGVIKAESDYYPWGGELQFVNNDSNHYKFTGKERDETGLDYFSARYYSNGLGRWVSADWSATPIPVPYADFHDPQSLNLYGYVGGNPASKADRDGHQQSDGDCICQLVHQIFEDSTDRDARLMVNIAFHAVSAYVAVKNLFSSNKPVPPPPPPAPAPTPTAGAVPGTQAGTPAVPLPKDLVGTPDAKSGPQGKRYNNGPLAPSNGGVGDAAKDFDTLTGSKSGPAPAGTKYPPGTLVGDNDIALRPAKGTDGPRIDIPANGTKPPETLHYPPTPPPTPPKPQGQS